MHCQGIVFGDQPEILMDSLMQGSSLPPADVWTPLDVTGADGRSGWHNVSDQYRQDREARGYSYGTAVLCVWPTSFLREHLGPYALLSDGALSSREVPRNLVQKKDGQWRAHLPRFFQTVGVKWCREHTSSRWQGRSSTDAAEGATVGSLDLEYNLMTHDPNLIVGPRGPVFYQAPDSDGHHVVRRRLDAALHLMELPGATPVTLVSWHDTWDRSPHHWYDTLDDPYEKQACDCLQSEYDFPYWHPTYHAE